MIPDAFLVALALVPAGAPADTVVLDIDSATRAPTTAQVLLFLADVPRPLPDQVTVSCRKVPDLRRYSCEPPPADASCDAATVTPACRPTPLQIAAGWIAYAHRFAPGTMDFSSPGRVYRIDVPIGRRVAGASLQPVGPAIAAQDRVEAVRSTVSGIDMFPRSAILAKVTAVVDLECIVQSDGSRYCPTGRVTSSTGKITAAIAADFLTTSTKLLALGRLADRDRTGALVAGRPTTITIRWLLPDRDSS